MKKRKIKIVHIVEGFVGGVSTYLCSVLPMLAETGFDVSLICSLGRCCNEADKKIEKLRKKGIKIYTVPMTRAINPLIDLYCFFLIAKILFKGNFDLVHTHCSKAGAIGRIAASVAGIKKRFHSSHCFAFLRCGSVITKRIYLFIERLLAGFTTIFIAVSTDDARSAKTWKIFPEQKCIIVNNGLSLNGSFCRQNELGTISKIKTCFNLPQNSFIVATGIRLVEYKGIFTFLKAAGLSKCNCTFVVAGDGRLRPKIEKYILANGLSQKVKLLGYISDMDRLYKICDLVVLCSDMEAQPYLILEAMRSGCAVVASDVPGNRELLTDERGLLVKSEPEKLAQAIDKLLSDRQYRERLTQNAHDYFYRHHRLESQVQKLIDVYLDGMKHKERKHTLADSIATEVYSK